MNKLTQITIDCFDKNMLIEYYIIICELLESKGIDTAKVVIEEKETWVRLYFENKDFPKDLNISNYLFSNIKDFSFLVEINELNLGKAYSYSYI